MDTRTKILCPNELRNALNVGEWVVIVGHFDPLTAAQAKRIAAVEMNGVKLAAIVLDDVASERARSLLPGEARATLIAALRAVDAVALTESGSWRDILPHNGRVRVVEDEEAEKKLSADFVRFIVDRQATAQERRTE